MLEREKRREGMRGKQRLERVGGGVVDGRGAEEGGGGNPDVETPKGGEDLVD